MSGPYTKAVCTRIGDEVRALLPADVTLIAGALNNGHNIGVGVVLSDGSRHAVKARGIDPVIVADMLLDWIAEVDA